MTIVPRGPLCGICNQTVELDIAVTDQNGKPLHGDCYARMIRMRQITQEKWQRLAQDKESLF
jgi:hypothetical protein